MSYSLPLTLSSSGGSVDFNPTDGSDGWYCTGDTTGLDAPDTRPVVDDKSQQDGYIVHQTLEGGMRPTIVAQYKINTGTVADRDTAIDDLLAVLRGMKNADGSLTQTLAAGARTLTVRYEVKLVTSGGAQLKQVAFGLVSEESTWADGT